MKKLLQNKLKNQKGLTLIELLAVIVILAIIAAIAIPAIGTIIENSRNGAVKADYQNALAAANIYFTENPELDIVIVSTLLGTAATGTTEAPVAGTPGYLDDAGSLTGDVEILRVTGGNTISGVANANDTKYEIQTAISNKGLTGIKNAAFSGLDIK